MQNYYVSNLKIYKQSCMICCVTVDVNTQHQIKKHILHTFYSNVYAKYVYCSLLYIELGCYSQ